MAGACSSLRVAVPKYIGDLKMLRLRNLYSRFFNFDGGFRKNSHPIYILKRSLTKMPAP